jgi:hypothetical protein
MRQSAKLALLGIAGLVYGLMSPVVWAADDVVLTGDHIVFDDGAEEALKAFGGQVNLQGDAKDDVLAAGGTVDIDMNVDGDLVAFGGNVALTGVANQDVLAVGGSVAVGLTISNDFDAVGGNIIISADSTVGGHASIHGGYVEVDGVYAGPVKAGGGEVNLIGQFASDVKVAATDVELNGYFSGDVKVTAGNVKFGDNVQFLGDLNVMSPDKVELPDGMMIGGEFSYAHVDESDIEDFGDLFSILWVGVIVALIALFFIFGFGTVIVAIADNASRRGVAMMRDETLKAFLYGVAVLVLGVIGLIVATAIYEPFAIASILYVILIMTGYVFAGYAALTLMIDKGQKPHGFGRRLGYSLLGLVALFFVGLIPLIGALVGLAAMIFGVGAFFGGLVGRDKVAAD